MPETIHYLRAGGGKIRSSSSSHVRLGNAGAGEIGVDDKNLIIRGAVLAEVGSFLTDGRGAFDRDSLAAIVRLVKAHPNGVRARFTHPRADLGQDALGTFLGRWRSPRLDGDYARADLWIDGSAFISPRGNLGQYVLALARSDHSSFGTSLVLSANKEQQRPARGSAYYPPPLWRPVEIFAADLVETPEASHSGLLPPPWNAQDATAATMREIDNIISEGQLT